MSPRHFLDIDAVPPVELRAILSAAAARKAARPAGGRALPDDDAPLVGRMLAMVFEKPSTRTRVSFDLGMRQLGGQTMVLNGAEMQFGHGESIADTARVLSRYVDAVMIRTFEHEKLMELAENATVPVINGLTDRTHPCQIMADIMTFEERVGPIAGRKLVWIGDGNNVCASFIQAAAAFGFELVVCGPEALDPAPDILASGGARVRIERDMDRAIEGADAIITDTWLSMNDPESTRARRHNLLKPFQVTEQVVRSAGEGAIFLHCLPAHRGEEVTDAVMDGPQSAVFDEAENRLHVQKAILHWCLGG